MHSVGKSRVVDEVGVVPVQRGAHVLGHVTPRYGLGRPALAATVTVRVGEFVSVPRERVGLPAPVVEPDVVLAGQAVHVLLVVVGEVLVAVEVVQPRPVRPAGRIVAEVVLAVPQFSCGGHPALVRAPVNLDGVDVALGAPHQLVDEARLDPEVRLVRVQGAAHVALEGRRGHPDLLSARSRSFHLEEQSNTYV